jgi:hypothetical protein
MKKHTLRHTIAGSMAIAVCALGMVGCTGRFEELNTNPFAPTPDQMLGDNAATASLIRNMIPALIQGQQNNSQMIDQMVGSEYGGCIACINPWGNSGNFYTLNPRISWVGSPFDTTMPQIYSSYFQIKELTGGSGIVFAWAQVLRIAGTLKLSDIYGPQPYSKVTGSEYSVAYDDMETLYDAMLADLDDAIATLRSAVLSGSDFSSLKDADIVYGGDFTKWVKYANTLKLRMAMRISSVKPTLAQQKAEEAANDVVGCLSTAADAAWSSYNDGMNPYYRAGETWNGGEFRLSANITSYLNGYSDPRLSSYAMATSSGEYVGVRNGIYQSASTFTAYQSLSHVNVGMTEDLLIMSASEAYFLRAEGALNGWNMGGTAQELYESGVRVAMNERGVQIGDYLVGTNGPADYVDPVNSSYNKPAMTDIAPAWDAAASIEANRERILIQKWIANYPNGWEAWADARRTGYPKFFPVVNNLNTEGVTASRGMRRVPFSQKEYQTNLQNINFAVTLLGGADTGATDLWWAKKK